MIFNSKGKIYYGMHFYPGVAEYQEPGKDPYRVFLNEDTIRSMDPSFAGKPIFVEHVNEVEEDINELRKDADGWVIESFYNAADGKHWVKFIVVSDRAEKAIQRGYRLSNAYIPNSFTNGGLWNGVSYAKEITGGEYEHLAIVQNPRYEESVIMTPEQFKQYNEDKQLDLRRLANSKKEKGDKSIMGKFNFFKRAKVENTIDPEICVILPKSGKEMTLEQVINGFDAIQNMDGYANMDHMVKIHDGSEMKVSDLVAKHKALNDEIEDLKKKKEDEAMPEADLEPKEEPVDVESVKSMDNDEDEEAKKKALQLAEHEEKEIEEAKKKQNELAKAAAKKAEAKKKADALRNAGPTTVMEEVPVIELMADQVARGKARYGS